MRILPRRSGIGSRIPDPEAKIEPFEKPLLYLNDRKNVVFSAFRRVKAREAESYS
jgi:hypothetical protein